MSQRTAASTDEPTIACTIRMPNGLRKRIATDADRCARSFEGQVIAVLRRHYDIAPVPSEILTLALATLAEVPPSEQGMLSRRLRERLDRRR